MAYKLKKKTNGRIVIKNVEFNKGDIVTVTKNVFDYVLKTFKDMFEIIEQEVAKVKPQKSQETVKKPVKDSK